MINPICTVGEFSVAMLVTFPKFGIDIAHFADCSKQISGALIYAVDIQKFAVFLRGSGYNAPKVSDKDAGSVPAFNDWLYNQCEKIAGYIKGYIMQKDSDKITFGIFELPPFKGFDLEPIKDFDLEPIKDFDLEPIKGFDLEPIKDFDLEPIKDFDLEPIKGFDLEPIKGFAIPENEYTFKALLQAKDSERSIKKRKK